MGTESWPSGCTDSSLCGHKESSLCGHAVSSLRSGDSTCGPQPVLCVAKQFVFCAATESQSCLRGYTASSLRGHAEICTCTWTDAGWRGLKSVTSMSIHLAVTSEIDSA